MLTRIWATLRTLYLLAVVGYTMWGMPWGLARPALTDAERAARCETAYFSLQKALGLALVWMALEVVLGWLAVVRSSRADRAELKKALREARSTQPPPPPAPPSPAE